MGVVYLRRRDGSELVLARDVFEDLARVAAGLLRACGYREVDRGRGFEPLPPAPARDPLPRSHGRGR